MFDIAFSELLVIGVIALIVIGPEKLPRMARTVGVLTGRLQRYVADVKADINREIELEELRKMRDSMQQAASDFQSSVQTEINQTETDLNKSVEDLNKSVEDLNKSVDAVDWREAQPAEATPAEKRPDEEKKPA